MCNTNKEINGKGIYSYWCICLSDSEDVNIEEENVPGADIVNVLDSDGEGNNILTQTEL